MRLNLLDRPLLARVVIDIGPDQTRRVYMSKFDAQTPADVEAIVKAVIWGAVDLAQRHGITITGFTINREEIPHGQESR
jgi:hypothetical protein